MAANAYLDTEPGENPLPLDLQMDLLVDGELAESQRKAVLLTMEKQTGLWRGLALRFLERQTEKQSVRALMAGGRVVPVEMVPVAGSKAKRGVLGYVGRMRVMATAAGLLIAVTSVMITLYAVRPVQPQTMTAEFQTSLPRDVVSADAAVPVSVPMVRAGDDAMVFPVSTDADPRLTKKAVIIQSDGRDGFIMIPVSTSKTKIY